LLVEEESVVVLPGEHHSLFPRIHLICVICFVKHWPGLSLHYI
jgi:hypothetical protein